MRRVSLPLLVALVLSVGLYIPVTSTDSPETVFAQDACIPSEPITAQNVGELTLLSTFRFAPNLHFSDDNETFYVAGGQVILDWQISTIAYEQLRPVPSLETVWKAQRLTL